MKTCACISLSGGQGKTTTILFLSMLLAQKGKRVLAIDADPQANLTFFLGHDSSSDEPTLLEVLRGEVQTEDGTYPTGFDNLFLIPSDSGLSTVVEYLSGSGTGAFVLKLRLKAVANLFDYALIDVQPSRSQISLTAVGAADQVLIPVETTTKGVNSLIDTLGFLNHQASLMAFNGGVLGVVPFRDRWVGNTQTRDSRESIDAMKEIASGVTIFPTVRESEQYKKAVRRGMLPSSLGFTDLEYPFERIIAAIGGEGAVTHE